MKGFNFKKGVLLAVVFTLCASLTIFAKGEKELVPYMSAEAVASSVATLPEPPQPGSVEFLLDEYHYFNAKLLRDTPRGKQAIEDAKMDGTVLLQFEKALGYKITEELMPATYHLLMRAMECFGTYGCNEAKQYYRRTRPFVYYNERSLVPKDEKWMKKSYSYPSGHSANFYGLGCILMALNPDRQNEIYNRAKEGAYSRVIVGAHWFSDTEASKIVAMTVFARLQSDPEFIADFQAAKEEIERITNKCK